MFLKSSNENLSSSINFFENILALSNFHNNVEILHVTSGAMRFSVNSSEYIINQGDFIVIFPFEIHKCLELLGDTNISCIGINVNRIDGYLPQIRKYSLANHVIKSKNVTSSANQIYSLVADENTQKNKELFTALTVALFFDLISCSKLIPKFNLEKNTYERIIYMCVENYKDNAFNLEKLSNISGLSSRTLSRFFKDYLEMSFPRFISQLRLESAISSILEGMSITEAAVNNGFGSLRTFNRVFSREHNCSPKDYFSVAENDHK